MKPPPAQMSMFDDLPATSAPIRQQAVKPPKNQPAKWSTNTTKSTCYMCVQQLADGMWIDARRATWRRETGTIITLLCYEHAQPIREADHEGARKLTREAHARRAKEHAA